MSGQDSWSNILSMRIILDKEWEEVTILINMLHMEYRSILADQRNWNMIFRGGEVISMAPVATNQYTNEMVLRCWAKQIDTIWIKDNNKNWSWKDS